MRGIDFIFDSVNSYYKCPKINFKRGGSNIDFANWIKNEKATSDLINKKNNKRFQYAVIVE